MASSSSSGSSTSESDDDEPCTVTEIPARRELFSRHDGYISKGGDLLSARMTIQEAKRKCIRFNGLCRGFCHRGTAADGVLEILFKSKWDNQIGTNSWTSYKYEADDASDDGEESGQEGLEIHTASAEAKAAEAPTKAKTADRDMRILQMGVRVRVLEGVCFKQQKGGDLGTVIGFPKNAAGMKGLRIIWDRTGKCTNHVLESWAQYVKFHQQAHVLQIGDRVQVLPGHGDALYKDADVGVVVKFIVTTQGQERIAIQWDGTGKLSNSPAATWREFVTVVQPRTRLSTCDDRDSGSLSVSKFVSAKPTETLWHCSEIIFFELVEQSAMWRSPHDFPHALGPFNFSPTSAIDPASLRLRDDSTYGKSWYIDDDVVLADGKLSFSSGEVFLHTSPLVSISWSTFVRTMLGVPAAATHFAWCYPACTQDQECSLDSSTPDLSFLVLGGYIFFELDDSDQFSPLEILALMNESDSKGAVGFDAPVAYKSAMFGEQLAAGHFHPITLSGFRKCGLTHFAWIAPDEVVGGCKLCPLGGFAYMYALDTESEKHETEWKKVNKMITRTTAEEAARKAAMEVEDESGEEEAEEEEDSIEYDEEEEEEEEVVVDDPEKVGWGKHHNFKPLYAAEGFKIGGPVVAKQRDGHPYVALRKDPEGKVHTKVANGTVVVLLAKRGEHLRIHIVDYYPGQKVQVLSHGVWTEATIQRRNEDGGMSVLVYVDEQEEADADVQEADVPLEGIRKFCPDGLECQDISEEHRETFAHPETHLKTACKYGKNCYRKNLQHLKHFVHPGDRSYRVGLVHFGKVQPDFRSLRDLFNFCDPDESGNIAVDEFLDAWPYLLALPGHMFQNGTRIIGTVERAWTTATNNGQVSHLDFADFAKWASNDLKMSLPHGMDLSHTALRPCRFENHKTHQRCPCANFKASEHGLCECGHKESAHISDAGLGTFTVRTRAPSLEHVKDKKLLAQLQKILTDTAKQAWTRDRGCADHGRNYHLCTMKCKDKRTPVPQDFKLIRVEQNVNDALWERFLVTRSAMRQECKMSDKHKLYETASSIDIGGEPLDRSINEFRLFHGASLQSCQGICAGNFSLKEAGKGATWKKAGESSGMPLYGLGIYFAEKSTKSDEYAQEITRRGLLSFQPDKGCCTMLVCRVVGGLCRLVDTHDFKPDELRNDVFDGPYHSVYGDREARLGKPFKEVVVYDNAQVFPEYLLYYKRVW